MNKNSVLEILQQKILGKTTFLVKICTTERLPYSNEILSELFMWVVEVKSDLTYCLLC